MTEILPLGSIVTLKGSSKKLMIAGRLQKNHGTQEVYDYCAVLWPEGHIDASHYYMFNQDQIENLYYIGMQDQEEFNFRFRLDEMEQKLRGGTALS